MYVSTYLIYQIQAEEASVMPTYKRQLSAIALTSAQDSLTNSQISVINDCFDEVDVSIALGRYDSAIDNYLKSQYSLNALKIQLKFPYLYS